MIHYQLQCDADHAFDGWFKNSAAFEQQADAGFLQCPICGTSQVRRALMAPAIASAEKLPVPVADKPVETRAPGTEAGNVQVSNRVAVNGAMPDMVRAMLQKLRQEVEKNCDYVGHDFAEEARRIHNGEAPERGVYGETTPDEAEALADEGINVVRIPWLPRADS